MRDVVVTGAAGKTGLAVIRACVARGMTVTAVIRRDAQADVVRAAGAVRGVVVDLADSRALAARFSDHDAIYHVPPNMHPDESALTASAIAAAVSAGARRFVLHSVLAPYLPQLPHHLRKAESECALRGSELDWTILQPASYAQNVLPYLDEVRRTGRWSLPYRPSAPFTPVDLDDVAEAAARVLGEDGHSFASYELCGPQVLNSCAMAVLLEPLLGRRIEVAHEPAGEEVLPDLRAMFDYYDRHGLVGNPGALARLIGLAPSTFAQAIGRALPA